MSRADDLASSKASLSSASNGKGVVVVDLTPNGALIATGPGPWVPFACGPGWAQIELSNSTTPSASVVLEGCILPGVGAPAQVFDFGALSGALASVGTPTFTGPAYLRLNVTAIAGASAGVTGAISGAQS